MYAHFRHVVGIASPSRGVPLVKLWILDNLISGYLEVQKSPHAGIRSEEVLVSVSDRNVDTLIRAVAADFHDGLEAEGARPVRQTAEPGTVLSLRG